MTRSIPARALVVALMATACISYKTDADSAAALPPVGTIRANPDSPMVPDSAAPDSQPQTPATPATKTANATATKARPDTTTILGRDSVIMPKRSGGMVPVKSDTNPR